jgi:nucleotide-binding universal stress UspA family protein
VESLVVEKGPAEALAELAGERNADMIVVGSHGERPIAAAILGSTPHRLLHLSSRPVLVVRG